MKVRETETKNKITLFSELRIITRFRESVWRHGKQMKLLLCTPELSSFVAFTAVIEARFESGKLRKAEFDGTTISTSVQEI